jgi:Spy/CpxP family protein refolding chaperone
MTKHSFLLTAGLALATVSLLATAGATEPAPPAPAAVQDHKRDEVVCKKERPTGSRISRTVCRKRSEIEDSGAAGRWLINRPKHGTRG